MASNLHLYTSGIGGDRSILFDSPNATVTKDSAVIGSHVYKIDAITAMKVETTYPQRATGIFLLSLGALSAALSILPLRPEQLVTAAITMLMGVFAWRYAKPRFAVWVTTALGSDKVLTLTDESSATDLVSAIETIRQERREAADLP